MIAECPHLVVDIHQGSHHFSLTMFLLQEEAGAIAIRKTAAKIVMIFFIVLVFSIDGANLQKYIQKKEFLEKKMTRD